MQKIGFGGGCHWCTEAVFQQIPEVYQVEQGWIKSQSPHDSFSEAVIVHFNDTEISLEFLLKVHLATHSSASTYSMRMKYRSAVYYFKESDNQKLGKLMRKLIDESGEPYITKVLPFADFKLNKEKYLNYFEKNQEAPFCQTYIVPKLRLLARNFGIDIKSIGNLK